MPNCCCIHDFWSNAPSYHRSSYQQVAGGHLLCASAKALRHAPSWFRRSHWGHLPMAGVHSRVTAYDRVRHTQSQARTALMICVCVRVNSDSIHCSCICSNLQTSLNTQRKHCFLLFRMHCTKDVTLEGKLSRHSAKLPSNLLT